MQNIIGLVVRLPVRRLRRFLAVVVTLHVCPTTPAWRWGWFESRGFKYATLPHAFGVLFLVGFHYHQARNHHPPSNSPGGKNRESSLPHCSLVPRYVLSLSKANFPGTFFHSITFLSPALSEIQVLNRVHRPCAPWPSGLPPTAHSPWAWRCTPSAVCTSPRT